MENKGTIPVLFDEQGIFQIDIATDELDPTDKSDTSTNSGERPIEQRPFVETFEPVRLKLESSVPPLVEEGTLDVAVKVSTLFGGCRRSSGPGRRQFNPKSYTSTRFPNHRFNLVKDNVSVKSSSPNQRSLTAKEQVSERL